MNCTPRLALPFISPGQAQKELLHNEALQRLDMLVAATVEEPPRRSPPDAPEMGRCYIVGDAATSVWEGKEGSLAIFTEGGWRFGSPFHGMTVYIRSADVEAVFRDGAWEIGQMRCSALRVDGQQVVGARSPAIASPAGGTIIDSEAREAITGVLAALRRHGLIET